MGYSRRNVGRGVGPCPCWPLGRLDWLRRRWPLRTGFLPDGLASERTGRRMRRRSSGRCICTVLGQPRQYGRVTSSLAGFSYTLICSPAILVFVRACVADRGGGNGRNPPHAAVRWGSRGSGRVRNRRLNRNPGPSPLGVPIADFAGRLRRSLVSPRSRRGARDNTPPADFGRLWLRQRLPAEPSRGYLRTQSSPRDRGRAAASRRRRSRGLALSGLLPSNGVAASHGPLIQPTSPVQTSITRDDRRSVYTSVRLRSSRCIGMSARDPRWH